MRLPTKTIAPSRADQPQHREAERRLARAGFADDADASRPRARHADAVDRLDVADRAAQEAALDREPDLDVVGRHDGVARRGSAGGGVALRLGGEQRLGVGMLRRGEDSRDRAGLDDAAVLHHGDVVGDLAHDAEIVGDEQHRHAVAACRIFEQIEDLRLHGDVERRRRLVGDEQVGPVGERHGDHHALALAAGELVRIGAEPLARDRGCRPPSSSSIDARADAVGAARAVQLEDFADLLLDGVQRVERGHRLLEHHGDPAPRMARSRVSLAVRRSSPSKSAPARRNSLRQQAHDGKGRDRFARAGFADEGERFAALQREGDAGDGGRGGWVRAERDGEVANVEEGRFRRHVPCSSLLQLTTAICE